MADLSLLCSLDPIKKELIVTVVVDLQLRCYQDNKGAI